MKKLTELTLAQEGRFGEFVSKWTDIGLSTTTDREKSEIAIRGLYALAKLKQPRVIWLPCPISAALSAVVYAKLAPKKSAKSVGSAVDSAVGSAVYSAVGSAVYSAVGSAVGSAIDSAVGSAVDSAVGSAVYSAAGSAVYSAIDSVGRSFFGGSLWSAGYAAWADYFSEVCGIAVDRHYLDATQHCGFYWMLDSLCFASEKPIQISRDERGRLHSEKWQSIGYRSGWGLWHWHGVQVDRWIIEQPSLITVEKIESESNAEVRRVMVERYGEGRYIVDSGLKPIAQDAFGDLFRKHFQSDTPLVYVKVRNSTAEPDGKFKDYFLSVNPAHYDGAAGRVPHAAIASTWRTTPSGEKLFFAKYTDYRLSAES